MRDVQKIVDAVSWYHDFDFGDGIRARTCHENPEGVREVWRFIEQQLSGIPFGGRTVLDVGAWDGYWSFFAERHGARSVLATDDATQRWVKRSGIDLARELLASTIEIREDVPAYELAGLGRTFDVILCLGVFYHLWDPLYAFTQLRHCCHRDTIVILEGELAWSGMTRGELRLAQSSWQECVLSSSAIEKLLALAYFRLDEQVWMHPWPADEPARPQVRIDRSMLLCRPFEGVNSAYAYRPHFGLARYDDRFGSEGGPEGQWRAEVTLLAVDDVVAPGSEFQATARVTNGGVIHWKAHEPAAAARPPLLSGHSCRPPRTRLDRRRAFLDKHIVPGEYRNVDPVAHYCRYIEDSGFAGRVTLGAQLWDAEGKTQIDRDYSRGFLDRDVGPGESVDVVVQMRAPAVAGVYTVRFDMVAEYICWFESVGSTPAVAKVTVR